MQKFKKWLKSPWVIGIGTALFSFALTVFYDVLKEKPILTTIGSFFVLLYKNILAILNFNLKVWWVLPSVVVLLICIHLVSMVAQKSETIKPKFVDYKEDYFRIWRWTWDWNWSNRERAWHVVRLTAHCPKCGTPMIDLSNYIHGVRFHCPRCDFNAEDYECEQAGEVEQVIFDNIERRKLK